LAWIGACFLKKKDSIAGDEAGEMDRNARFHLDEGFEYFNQNWRFLDARLRSMYSFRLTLLCYEVCITFTLSTQTSPIPSLRSTPFTLSLDEAFASQHQRTEPVQQQAPKHLHSCILLPLGH
jgi:hypothetical protein